MHDEKNLVPTLAPARPRRRHRGMATGVGLILLGVFFLLHNLDVLDFRSSWEWWPFVLVFIGLMRMLERDRGSGLWLVVIGLWLLVNEHEMWGFTYGNSWPLIVVVVGVAMVWKALRGTAAPPPANGESR